MKLHFILIFLSILSFSTRAADLSSASNSALIAELERRLNGSSSDLCGEKKLIPQFSCDGQRLNLSLLNRLLDPQASEDIGNFGNKATCELQLAQFKNFGNFCEKKTIASCSNYSGIYPQLYVYDIGPDGIKRVSQKSANDIEDCLSKARLLNENS